MILPACSIGAVYVLSSLQLISQQRNFAIDEYRNEFSLD